MTTPLPPAAQAITSSKPDTMPDAPVMPVAAGEALDAVIDYIKKCQVDLEKKKNPQCVSVDHADHNNDLVVIRARLETIRAALANGDAPVEVENMREAIRFKLEEYNACNGGCDFLAGEIVNSIAAHGYLTTRPPQPDGQEE